MPMRGLTIVVADVSSERFRTALSLASATAALGARARIFLQGESVSILREPIVGWEDDACANAGLPTLRAQYRDARDLGVRFILCQSGLHLTGAEPRDYDPATEFAGMVSVLTDLGDDRLLVV
ncbi:MAG TPA: DsrE family protein [Sphingomonas sp.]|jgi:predicted peroxiredoxin|uniref:DsrE family protein n=1 Tax=Sphingomonas sp. TaxID=28214 RepID=UPI002ED84A9C